MDILDRRQQEPCEICAFFVNHQEYFHSHPEHSYRFCWNCGRPLTEEARAELERGWEETMERLTYDFCVNNNHCWQVKGADNYLCADVCKNQEESGCDNCPIKKAIDRLAAYENTGLEPEEIMERLHPDNLPLTLDELREMDGESVWVERSDAGTSRWAIVGDSKSLYGFYFGTGAGGLRLHYDDYGKTWLAYRRKPEEGTT